jgi:hypothetical protein
MTGAIPSAKGMVTDITGWLYAPAKHTPAIYTPESTNGCDGLHLGRMPQVRHIKNNTQGRLRAHTKG